VDLEGDRLCRKIRFFEVEKRTSGALKSLDLSRVPIDEDHNENAKAFHVINAGKNG
jgi:hypothetical protein